MGALMTSFETTGPITATIDVVVGDVRITAGDHSAVVVDVRPSDGSNQEDVTVAERTRVEFANEQLLVKAPKVRSWRTRSAGGSIDVTIELPAGSSVRGTGQMTDFTGAGPLGDTRIKTGLGAIALDEVDVPNLRTGIGDVAVERATGHADINAGSGDVRVAELAATAVIKNSNGDTSVGAAQGDLRISAGNGSIAVDHAGATVVAKSANGDVRLGRATRGSVVLETRLGDVEVGIPEGTAAWLDVRATAGQVRNELEAATTPEPGAEMVEVRARTTVGAIVVRRS
jgi:Putative adhesin